MRLASLLRALYAAGAAPFGSIEQGVAAAGRRLRSAGGV